ncbi:hypothetical protein CPB97_004441 [Podila verticillata]|nr:hypothetical protein CPB97_004441 [Podila verticillata]
MLTNLGYSHNNKKRIVAPLPMSAVYNKQQFISQFASLHQQSTQIVLVSQLLSTPLPGINCEYWIIYDDFNRPVACAGANTVMSDPSVGYVGLFEAKEQQAGTAVLRAATEWLRRGGVSQFEPVRQILGPVNLTTWLQYRLRVDTDKTPSMSFEPRHPEFYQECFAQAGYVKAVDYYTTFFEINQMIAGFERYLKGATLESYGMALQPWNTLDFPASLNPDRNPDLSPQDNVAKRVYDLSIVLFRGKELFDEGLSRENHRQIVLNDMISRPEVDNASLLDLSWFIVEPSTGEDIGYLAAWKEGDTLVLKTVGFVPKVRKSKVYAIALLETIKRARTAWGCIRAAGALMNENSSAISEYLSGPATRHTYRLYMHQPTTTVCDHDSDTKETNNNVNEHAQATVTATTSQKTSASLTSSANDQLKRQQLRLAHMNQRMKHPRSQGRPMARL